MKKPHIITIIIAVFTVAFGFQVNGQQQINGGSAQGLMSAVPEASTSEKLKDFKNIKPENNLGWWKVNISATHFSFGSLQVVIDYDIDIPSIVHGYTASGGEKHYSLNELSTDITGSVHFKLTAAYTDLRTKERKTFTKNISVFKLGKTKHDNIELFGYSGSVKDLTSVSEILNKLDVRIISIEAIEKHIRGYTRADQEVGKIIEKGKKESSFNNMVADAKNAEAFGRIDEAIEKYTAAYNVKQDPSIKAKIDELKNKKKEQDDQQLSNTQKQQQEEKSDNFNGTPGNSAKQDQEQDNSTATAQNNNQGQVELDFWGNPVTKRTNDGKAETVTYAGTEVQNNEHYRSEMAQRARNANAREAHKAEQAAERKRVDDHNDAIFAQAQRGIEQTNRDIAEMDKAIGQLDYSSGKGLLESSGNLARAATATGNVGQAKGALIGMGVGAVMAIGEGAAKRNAIRKAREKRERLEKERIAALKKALRNARTSVFRYFEPGELPMSSTRASGNNLYYFVYAVDNSQIEENTCKIYASNVFAVGRYPDGTWPMKTRIEEELNALTPLEEVIHGPYPSFEEAQRNRKQFSTYAQKARMEIVVIEHKGFNVQAEGNSRTSTGPALDFFGNPINPKKQTVTKQPQKKTTVPQKTQTTELDFFGNPIKK